MPPLEHPRPSSGENPPSSLVGFQLQDHRLAAYYRAQIEALSEGKLSQEEFLSRIIRSQLRFRVLTRSLIQQVRVEQEARGRDRLHPEFLTPDAFDNMLRKILSLSKRRSIPGCLLYIDLDDFKDVNDALKSHEAADQVLVHCQNVIARETRREDIKGRMGDEMFVYLIGTDKQSATLVAERIRQTIPTETSIFDIRVGRPQTVSIGITQTQPEDTVSNLKDRADLRMYMAKQTKNTTVDSGLFEGENR